MILSLSYYIMVLVGVLVSVSFYTLYERKVLGAGHLRKGPNIVGVWGLLQPFSDAIKLFTKELVLPFKSNLLLYSLSPILILMVSLMSWALLPYPALMFNYQYLVLLFFVLTAAGVYLYLAAGWSSNSSYSVIGGLRCVAQSISYEVSMVFLFMLSMLLYSEVDLFVYFEHQTSSWLIWLAPPFAVMWVISCLAETNRSPFDFAEGESELVSGFNLEYGSIGFAMLFMAEYASMIFMSFMLSVVFMGGMTTGAPFLFSLMLMLYMFIWVRLSYPRTRYDKLMQLCWIVILPISLLGLLSSASFVF